MDDDFASALATLGEKPQSFAPPTQQTARPSNNPGNLRPVGASQGFQSFATPEDGLSAIDKNLLAYHKHGINSISGVINRWAPPSENNTNAYISDVSKRLSVHPDQQIDLSNPIVRQALTTAINLHENGPGILTRKSAPSAAPQQAAAAQPAPAAPDDDFTNAINMSSAPAAQQAPAQSAHAPQTSQTQAVPITQSLASAMPLPGVKLASMVGQKYLPKGMNPNVDTSGVTDTAKQLGAGAVSLGDTLGNGASGLIKQLDYAGRRAVGQTPEQATKQSNEGVGSYFENPVSKFVNSAGKLINGADPKIEESAGYKSEASSGVMKFIGDNIGKGADWISGKTGLPKSDVENMLNTGLMGAVPVIGKGIGKAGSSVVKSLESANQELSGSKPLSSMLKAGEAPTAEVAKPRLKLSTDGTVSTVAPVETPQPSAAVRTGWNTDAPQGSVGAAATSLDSRFSQASPEMQAAYALAKKRGPIDPVSAERHLAADSLNAGVELMPGQASGNIHLISDENNLRAKRPDYADRFNAQNEGLKKKLTTIQDEAAPDVYSTGPTSSGENMMKAYKVKDAALKKDISANYQALKDANGGDFPMSTREFLASADASLKQNLKTAYVPKEIASQLEEFRSGAPMNFEQFEALRTNLSNEVRKAERSGDGNAAYASGIVRNALENIPLTPEAAHLKPLADKARNSAASRFDLLKKDPAYKATISESISADKFIEKHVINGYKKDIQTMRENLAHDPAAQQQIAHATIDWLKRKGGLVDGIGTLGQDSYNKSLSSIHEKLGDMVGSEAANTLRTVGEVARYTQAQPKGSYVNNSGTLVAALKHNVVGAAENLGNAAVPFFNFGTSIRNKIDNRAVAQSTKKTLETGAGLVNLKDIGK